jgi:hypothetical protein
MEPITHGESQWRKLCRCLDLEALTTDAEDVIELLGYNGVPVPAGFLRVDVAPDVDADAIAAQIAAVVYGLEIDA